MLLAEFAGGTSGDFSLLNFLWLHREDDPYTYDDANNQLSYFYIRERASRLPVMPTATA